MIGNYSAHTVVHVLVALALPPLLLGVINKVKALFGGRIGPPVLQPYYDLVKLLRKGSVFSETTTWVFRFGPVASMVACARWAAPTAPTARSSTSNAAC